MQFRELIPPSRIFLAATWDSDRRRFVWQAIALVAATALAWLVFAAYRQPDLLLDLAALRLC